MIASSAGIFGAKSEIEIEVGWSSRISSALPVSPAYAARIYDAVIALSERVSVLPVTVLVVIVPTSLFDISETPPPEEPSCAAAEPPSASTSIVVDANVKISLTEPKTMVGKRPECI